MNVFVKWAFAVVIWALKRWNKSFDLPASDEIWQRISETIEDGKISTVEIAIELEAVRDYLQKKKEKK